MRTFFLLLILLAASLLLQGCSFDRNKTAPELPLSGGIQVSLHTTGGSEALNETLQISDHWQFSSVGRRHGWIRKLEPDEQRQLVKAMQVFDTLEWSHTEEVAPTEAHDHISYTLTARGSGEGPATKKEARELAELLEKFTNAKRVVSR